MALLIKQTVNQKNLSAVGCYVNISVNIPFEANPVFANASIWANRADFEANPTAGTIQYVEELQSSYKIDSSLFPSQDEGKDVLNKLLWSVNQQVKDSILAANPTWQDKDIDIVDIPKI